MYDGTRLLCWRPREGVSERVWCISDQMDFTPGSGRCPIAQQTVTYLFKLGSDIFNVLSSAYIAAAPWAATCWLGLNSSTIMYKLHCGTWLGNSSCSHVTRFNDSRCYHSVHVTFWNCASAIFKLIYALLL